MRKLQPPYWLIGSLLCLAPAAPAVLRGQEFRVETSVFAGESRQPLAKNLALFTEGLVFDISLTGAETTVFDSAQQRFVLLDRQRSRHTELNLEELGSYVAAVKQQGLETKEQYLFDPQFAVSYSDDSRRLTLTSDAVTYRVKGIVPPESHTAAVAHYRQFTDWSARLNATHTASFPPFARLELNGRLHDRNLLPEHVEFEYTPPGRAGSKAVYQSRQAFAWTLTDDDRRRIEETKRQLVEFTPVKFREYRESRP